MIQAAKYLGVAPWELLERPSFWTNAALVSLNAEHRAREYQQQKASKKR